MDFIKSMLDKIVSNKTETQRQEYNFDTVEDIMAIPIPKYKKLDGIGSPVDNIEYILQRKATQFKKDGKMELAIACLRKSNEIMPHSNFNFSKKDYLRLVEFLKQNGQFDEAREEENKINQFFDKQLSLKEKDVSSAMNVSAQLGTDLVMTVSNIYTVPCCENCAKLRNRVYSISGKDKRFPKFTEEVSNACCLRTYPFVYGATSLENSKQQAVKDVIAYSNRPFDDDRTTAEKKRYTEFVKREEQKRKDEEEKEKDKKEFDLIREYLPSDAPKSFTGYRKMKNSNSENYQKLMQLVKENNIF